MLVKASLSGRLVLLSKLNSYYALSVGLLCMRRSNIVPMLQNREEYVVHIPAFTFVEIFARGYEFDLGLVSRAAAL